MLELILSYNWTCDVLFVSEEFPLTFKRNISALWELVRLYAKILLRSLIDLRIPERKKNTKLTQY